MSHDQPDYTEKGIRFGCGGLFGLFVALMHSVDIAFIESDVLMILYFSACFIFFGTLAVRFGNYFWDNLRQFLGDD